MTAASGHHDARGAQRYGLLLWVAMAIVMPVLVFTFVPLDMLRGDRDAFMVLGALSHAGVTGYLLWLWWTLPVYAFVEEGHLVTARRGRHDPELRIPIAAITRVRSVNLGPYNGAKIVDHTGRTHRLPYDLPGIDSIMRVVIRGSVSAEPKLSSPLTLDDWPRERIHSHAVVAFVFGSLIACTVITSPGSWPVLGVYLVACVIYFSARKYLSQRIEIDTDAIHVHGRGQSERIAFEDVASVEFAIDRLPSMPRRGREFRAVVVVRPKFRRPIELGSHGQDPIPVFRLLEGAWRERQAAVSRPDGA